MKEILTLRPTLEEMKIGMVSYIEQVMERYPEAGCVKVVTPPEWRDILNQSKLPDDGPLDFIVSSPILQRAVGERGAYQFALVALQDTTLREFEIKSARVQEEKKGMLRGNYDAAEFERAYWKNISYITPEYGADMQGSIFGDADVPWNTNSDLLNVLSALKVEMPGVNSSYLYVGQMFSSFCWHVEDKDLFAVNYMHFGAPKTWYSIPVVHARRFEALAQELFPSEARRCNCFLRHKTSMISPAIIEKAGIPVETCQQFPGEFVFSLPRGYHCGFSHGFNCAESINFATPRWFPLGRAASMCYCDENSIDIDVNELADRYCCLLRASEYSNIDPTINPVDLIARFKWSDIIASLERFSEMDENTMDLDQDPSSNSSPHEKRKAAAVKRSKADNPPEHRAVSPMGEKPSKQPRLEPQDSVPGDSPYTHVIAQGGRQSDVQQQATYIEERKEKVAVTVSEIDLSSDESLYEASEGADDGSSEYTEHHEPPFKKLAKQKRQTQKAAPKYPRGGPIIMPPMTSLGPMNTMNTQAMVAPMGGPGMGTQLRSQGPALVMPRRIVNQGIPNQEMPGQVLPMHSSHQPHGMPQGPIVNNPVSNTGCMLVPLASQPPAPQPMPMHPTLKALDMPCRFCLDIHGMEHPLDMKYVALKKFLRSHSQIPFSAIRPCRSLADLHTVYHDYPSCHPSFGPCTHHPERRQQMDMMFAQQTTASWAAPSEYPIN